MTRTRLPLSRCRKITSGPGGTMEVCRCAGSTRPASDSTKDGKNA